MARYIDVDKFAEKICDFQAIDEDAANKMIWLLRTFPTADVAEVVYAKWEISSDGYYPYCSHCKTEPENGVMSKHCPECGAKMDIEKE